MMGQTFTLTWPQTLLFLGIALLAGAGLYASLDVLRRLRLRRQLERVQKRSIRNPNYGRFGTATQGEGEELAHRAQAPGAVFLERITIRNFKNIENLQLDLMRPSSLTGEWTCLAGINGAGKTSILQAMCLVLLGDELVNELGRGRLGRMLRRTKHGTVDAEIEAFVRSNGKRTRLYLPLRRVGDGEATVDTETLREQDDFPRMRDMWKRLHGQVFVGYGASRNVSDFKDSRHMSYSRAVQRQMTLFDPLTQLASVDLILEGGERAKPVVETLYRLLVCVLQSEAIAPQAWGSGDKLRFAMHDTTMDVIDLPDGFRSTVAWLADVCAEWHERQPKAETDPSAITGIVLLDEIGLHLHPRLEKSLVPQLRRALPRVQFIVSTHSPLVLASFDREELIVLDAGAPGGTKEIDRQLFGLTMDDVYEYLMNTSPGSRVMEEMLESQDDHDVAVYLYQSKDVNEDLARQLIDERKKDIEALERARDLS